MRTFLLGLFLFLIVFEVILQFSAKILNPYGNYPEFFELARFKLRNRDLNQLSILLATQPFLVVELPTRRFTLFLLNLRSFWSDLEIPIR